MRKKSSYRRDELGRKCGRHRGEGDAKLVDCGGAEEVCFEVPEAGINRRFDKTIVRETKVTECFSDHCCCGTLAAIPVINSKTRAFKTKQYGNPRRVENGKLPERRD